MGNIVLLDDLTINQIAAGEVIERPASVVKEMVENSIDAGAKNIEIEIKNGGISLIKITDDGCGIAEDDMEIAFERHATSKIRSAADLSKVKSMGFRGEALASIAAISSVEMISRNEKEDIGHKIVVEGGKTIKFTECARNVGTTIIVNDLFYNTPVRYKFLKKDYTEAGYIEDIVTKIALVNKDIAFKLISNGKTIIQTNGNGDINTVIYSIFGKDIAAEVVNVDYDYEGIKVTGVIGKPVISRGNRSNQMFFVNGRSVKDKNLTAAVDQAYKGIVTTGRYAFVVLNLEMDPETVDVNVHPSKLEVRFEDDNKVFKAVYHTIKANLIDLPGSNKEEIKDQFEINTINSSIQEPVEKEKINEVKNVVNERPDFETRLNALKQEKEGKEKKGGLSGLFKKIIKEPEETDEELNNNSLEEIYKFRQHLDDGDSVKEDKDETSKVEEIKEDIKEEEKPELREDTNFEYDNKIIENLKNEFFKNNNFDSNDLHSTSSFNVINKDVVNKKIEVGDTVISSETREINVTDVNELIKEATQKMNSLKFDNKQETQRVDLKQIQEESNSPVEQEINDSIEEVNNRIKQLNNEFIEKDKVNQETNVENQNDGSFEEMAEKLISEKLVSNNTQSIDTSKVREAMKEEKIEEEIESIQNNPEFNQMYKETFGTDSYVVRKEKEKEEEEKNKYNVTNEFDYVPDTENMSVFENVEEKNIIPYKYIGMAFDNYLVIEIKDEMYIIDKVIASERLMYEQLIKEYYSEETNSEQLLMPDVIEVNKKELHIAKENTEMFLKAGFEYEEFGENTLKLSSVPSICEQLNTKQLFQDILQELDKVAVTAKEEKERRFIATVARKIVAENIVGFEEKDVKGLLDDLLSLNDPFSSTGNKPVAIKMTRADLEKKFSRR